MNSRKGATVSSNAVYLLIRVNLYALIFVFLIVSVASPALIDTISINSHGTISNEVTVPSGTAADIQAAVNQMDSMGGGTVHLPAETFYFNDETVQIPGGVNVIGAGIENTILQQNKPATFNTMFYLDGDNIRVSGIEFKGLMESSDIGVDGSAIQVRSGIDFRIDHCKFIDFPDVAIGVSSGSTRVIRGVIDHNIFDNPYKDEYPSSVWGYGIVISSSITQDWDDDITHFLGKYETIPTIFPTVYIEDNVFDRTRHAVASNQLGWYVFRYNTASQTWNSIVDVHGSSPTAGGGRGCEVYGNTLIGTVGIGLRGGSGVVWNNTIQTSGADISIIKDQSGTLLRPLNDYWIWDNGDAVVTSDGNYIEDQDYFLREPNQAQDGFTYTPYPYPHPLTLSTTP